MEKGLICVSVCARTAAELVKKIAQAEELGEAIEARFDCLDESELRQAIKIAKSNRPLIATYRPQTEGGRRELTIEQRLKFWQTFLWRNRGREVTVDLETDIFNVLNLEKIPVILSFHSFAERLENEGVCYDAVSQRGARIIKAAYNADAAEDSLPVWRLLGRAAKDRKHIIPIAMGEAGKWTRILGLAHGAFMTYAALDEESATAPGQITARDLRDVYRVKELNLETEVYGIIGNPVGHSRSPYIHNAAFKAAGRNAVFVPLEVVNLGEFMRRMVRPATREAELNFCGFSVTIPHKRAIIEFLDEVDETAAAIGAVNTVKIRSGKLYGYNTDAAGFIQPLLKMYGDVKGARVASLGAGGGARACVYALKNQGADVTVFARNAEIGKAFAEEFDCSFNEIRTANDGLHNFDILVNATPVGMRGKAKGESPVEAKSLAGLKLVYDLIYTPEKTKLLNDADSLGIKNLGGTEMLLGQAAEQQKIWNN